jgi:hypothetical protein
MNDLPVFRCVKSEDLPEMLRIQQQNPITNLSENDRADGFLSVAFSSGQFEAMNHQLSIIVADLGSRLPGFLCGSR